MKKHPENHPFLKNVTISKTYKCKLCNYTTDQSNNVLRHALTKQHENKPPQKGEIENHPTLDMITLENKVLVDRNEYQSL